MLEEEQGHQETEAFNAEVKSSDIFNKVLGGVGEALCEWYHIKEEEIPCLDPERIKFVSDEGFMSLEREDKVGDTLVNQALRLSGVKPEFFPGRKDFKTGVTYANPFSRPLTIYLRQSESEGLLNQDRKSQFGAALILGFNLMELNLALLPKPQETQDPELVELSIAGLLKFFQQLQTSAPKGAKPEELEKARKVFRELLENDPTKKTLLYGAQIILAFEDKGVLKGQFPIGERFEEGVIHFLANKPEKLFVQRLTRGLPWQFSLRVKGKREQEIRKARDFLRKLKLEDYWSVFKAYKESRIPEIFLERLKVKPGLEYPS